jgi:hypothetical protein
VLASKYEIMEFTLRNIYCYGEHDSNIFMSIGVLYGWSEAMHTDVIRLNYDGAREKIFLTVKAKNPGIGIVIESIISLLMDIDSRKDGSENKLELIIDILSQKLGMKYDHEKVEGVIAQHQIYLLKHRE